MGRVVSIGSLQVPRREMNEFVWVQPLFLSNVVALASGPGYLCDSLRGSGNPLGFSVLQEWEEESVRSLHPMRNLGVRS